MVRKLDRINKFWYAIFVAFSAVAILVAINYTFKLNLFGYTPIDTAYLYILLALYLSGAFLLFPAHKSAPMDKVPWYDVVLFSLNLVVNLYFVTKATDIPLLGWSMNAPLVPTLFSVILWFLVLESLRRTSGTLITVICGVFSFYPLYASFMPGVLKGLEYDFFTTARNHAMGIQSILGTPLMTVGTLLVGFMVFGVVLNDSGGGKFFHELALALLGRKRGGTAKVAVVGSALFGSLSGSAVSNVVTIGTITIPAMKKAGYEPKYAAAIESCAATGGTIMPPIMGAAAFIMASFMGVPYAEIIIAAAIPSILYYLGLFVQVDAHAGKLGLKGLPDSQIPPLKETIARGWPFVFVLVVLFYFLLIVKIETYAPYYASLILILIALFRKDKEDRLNLNKFIVMIANSGKVLIELVSILAGVGLIVGSLSITGVALAFSRELVMLVGGNLFLLLLAGALTSFILGMGMTSTACYIFLAIVLVPALTAVGVPEMSAHFFVLYWGIISFITPPVALAAFAAAKIAGSDAMKTGVTAMRLGVVTFFVPFLFAYDPHLVAQGDLLGILYSFLKTALGVILIGSALEGYLIFFEYKLNYLLRISLLVSATFVCLPIGITDVIGVICTIGILAFVFVLKKREKAKVQLSTTNL